MHGLFRDHCIRGFHWAKVYPQFAHTCLESKQDPPAEEPRGLETLNSTNCSHGWTLHSVRYGMDDHGIRYTYCTAIRMTNLCLGVEHSPFFTESLASLPNLTM